MIGYLFLSAGTCGFIAVGYFVIPAGRGLHRYVVPRAQLRAEAAKSTEHAEELACKLVALASELDAVTAQRDELTSALEKASLRIADLEEQLHDADQLRGENTALKAALDNARAIRPLQPVHDVSALDDSAQEFTDLTATAWRARA
ncbi:hypothetical protein ACFVP3_23365 [Streptomyces sp. NPDC057806]|uniref:hypothetical protein n=1 Tax=Streptomyces sp. NPDC057806 TaxID=3346255 RepID=UPI0036B5286E